MANRVDPDETACYEPSHLDLCHLIWIYTVCTGIWFGLPG